MIVIKFVWQIKNVFYDILFVVYNILQFCLQKQLDFFLFVVIYLLFYDVMKKKNINCFYRLQLVYIKINFVLYIYLLGNLDYEKLQNCIYYWQWIEKIYFFFLYVLVIYRKIQKYFDFIRRLD